MYIYTMELQEAKQKFISTWGSLGTSWGINKAMAQIQALLFVNPEPMAMEDIMEALKISRGNASMNLRQLIDWGIVSKTIISGERKDYYTTEKDVEELARIIAKERSRRELKPVVKSLQEISNVTTNGNPDAEFFKKQTKDLLDLAHTVDTIMNKVANQKRTGLTKPYLKCSNNFFIIIFQFFLKL